MHSTCTVRAVLAFLLVDVVLSLVTALASSWHGLTCAMLLRGITPLRCAELTALCHNPDVVSSEALIDAGMQAIFQGILSLEVKLDKLAELGVHVRPFSGQLPP